MRRLVLVACLFAGCAPPVSPGDSHSEFIPDDITRSSIAACYIGGTADGSEAHVQVMYHNEGKSTYLAMIAKYPWPSMAAHECKEWWAEVEQTFRKAEAGK